MQELKDYKRKSIQEVFLQHIYHKYLQDLKRKRTTRSDDKTMTKHDI